MDRTTIVLDGNNFSKRKLKTCHPSNIDSVKTDLELAKGHVGQTLFEIIVEIISEQHHIELVLQ